MLTNRILYFVATIDWHSRLTDARRLSPLFRSKLDRITRRRRHLGVLSSSNRLQYIRFSHKIEISIQLLLKYQLSLNQLSHKNYHFKLNRLVKLFIYKAPR